MNTPATSKEDGTIFWTLLSVVLLLLCSPGLARDKKEPNPNLANIHKVFIKGNSEAGTAARKRFLTPKDRAMRGVACFGPVGNEALADGTLEISQDTAPDGKVTVSGTLMDRQGSMLWSDSKRSLGIGDSIISEAEGATAVLMSGFEDEMCGVPPLIELSKVRKIAISPYILSVYPESFKNVTWKSGCITFVAYAVDADALLMPDIPLGWVLFDPKNNDKIPGWQTNSFRGIAELAYRVSHC
jgi:hypothetical protein